MPVKTQSRTARPVAVGACYSLELLLSAVRIVTNRAVTFALVCVGFHVAFVAVMTDIRNPEKVLRFFYTVIMVLE